MIINTVAASGVVFVTLQASAFETGYRLSASTRRSGTLGKSQTRDSYDFACLAGGFDCPSDPKQISGFLFANILE
jgi:hypothetical protein